MNLLIIDNYDSFTFNLVHYAEPYVDSLRVVRNDEISLSEVNNYDAIILSPGPGTPSSTGISIDVVKTYGKSKKILGVCMGMQVIVEAHGGSLINMKNPLHGIAINTHIVMPNHDIFKNLPDSFLTGRYHSWVVDEESLPVEFEVTAKDELGYVQAIRHKEYPMSGVQFHPESVLTEHGLTIIKNWIRY